MKGQTPGERKNSCLVALINGRTRVQQTSTTWSLQLLGNLDYRAEGIVAGVFQISGMEGKHKWGVVVFNHACCYLSSLCKHSCRRSLALFVQVPAQGGKFSRPERPLIMRVYFKVEAVLSLLLCV